MHDISVCSSELTFYWFRKYDTELNPEPLHIFNLAFLDGSLPSMKQLHMHAISMFMFTHLYILYELLIRKGKKGWGGAMEAGVDPET